MIETWSGKMCIIPSFDCLTITRYIPLETLKVICFIVNIKSNYAIFAIPHCFFVRKRPTVGRSFHKWHLPPLAFVYSYPRHCKSSIHFFGKANWWYPWFSEMVQRHYGIFSCGKYQRFSHLSSLLYSNLLFAVFLQIHRIHPSILETALAKTD